MGGLTTKPRPERIEIINIHTVVRDCDRKIKSVVILIRNQTSRTDIRYNGGHGACGTTGAAFGGPAGKEALTDGEAFSNAPRACSIFCLLVI